jgi:hypothetical protein
MATTTNYGWTTPDDTALVKDGAAAIRTLGSSVDTTTKNLNPETTLGDLAYRSSTANVKTRLALGTANQQLRVNSGATAPEWFTPVASGGMTLINSGGTTLTGASVTIGSIPATYKNLQLVVRNYKPANDGEQLTFRFNGDATASRHATTNAVGGSGSFAATKISTTDSQDNSVATGLTVMNIYDYANTDTMKMLLSFSLGNNHTTNTNWAWVFYQGFYNQTTAVTSIELANTAGNFTSGTAFLYGVS